MRRILLRCDLCETGQLGQKHLVAQEPLSVGVSTLCVKKDAITFAQEVQRGLELCSLARYHPIENWVGLAIGISLFVIRDTSEVMRNDS